MLRVHHYSVFSAVLQQRSLRLVVGPIVTLMFIPRTRRYAHERGIGRGPMSVRPVRHIRLGPIVPKWLEISADFFSARYPVIPDFDPFPYTFKINPFGGCVK